MNKRKLQERLSLVASSLTTVDSAIKKARDANGETHFIAGGAEDETLDSLIVAVRNLSEAVAVLSSVVRDSMTKAVQS